MEFRQSSKLAGVSYEIRGPVVEHANELERSGHDVLRLNIGNPAAFGFEVPEWILQELAANLPAAHGYSDSRGLPAAREAVVRRYRDAGVADAEIEDVFLGNGVSELASMAVQALVDDGDEVLIPA